MSQKRNTAEEAARSRKILSKNEQFRLSSSVKKDVAINTADRTVGSFGSVVIAGPAGTTQFTICRPIGITNLADNDWVIIPTEEIPQAVLRVKDPDSQEINLNRSNYRTSHLVDLGLLIRKDAEGRRMVYYKTYSNASRATVLDAARRVQKQEKKAIREQLEELPKKGSGPQRQILNAELQSASDVTKFIEPPEVRILEKVVQVALRDPDLNVEVETMFPTHHRTLVGPYGNKGQQVVHGATGKLLVDVMAGISGRISRISLLDPGSGKAKATDPTSPSALQKAAGILLSPASSKKKKKGKA